MDLILYKNEIILIAPIGAIVDNISRNTYYTSLGISINRMQGITISSYIRKL